MSNYIDTNNLYRMAHSFSTASFDMRRQAGRVQSTSHLTEGSAGWKGAAGDAFRAMSEELYGDFQTFCDAFDRASSTLQSLAAQFDQVNELRRQIDQVQASISSLRYELAGADEHRRSQLHHEISQLNWHMQDLQRQADSQYNRADHAASGSFHDILALLNRLHVTTWNQTAATSSAEPSTWDKVGDFFKGLWNDTEEFVDDAVKEGGVAGGVLGFFEGIGDSVLDTLKGLWEQSAFNQAYQAIRDPESAARKAKDIWKDISHPVEAWEEWHPLDKAKVIWSSISNGWQRDMVDGNAYTRSKWVGYAVGTVLQAVLTDGIATEAGAAAKVANVETRADEILAAERTLSHVEETAPARETVVERVREVESTHFTDAEDAHAWGSQHYGDWTRTLTPDEYEAVHAYTGDHYRNINNVLRGISPEFEGDNARYTELISQALQKNPVPEAVTVYRGTSKAAFGKLNELPYQEWIGADIVEDAFMSTALVESSSFGGDVKLILKVPAGTPGAYVGELSMYKAEAELLLDKGTKFTITDIQQFGTKIQIIGAVKLH